MLIKLNAVDPMPVVAMSAAPFANSSCFSNMVSHEEQKKKSGSVIHDDVVDDSTMITGTTMMLIKLRQ